MTTELQDIDLIPISIRLMMVEDIWDSIARSQADIPVYDWQKRNWLFGRPISEPMSNTVVILPEAREEIAHALNGMIASNEQMPNGKLGAIL